MELVDCYMSCYLPQYSFRAASAPFDAISLLCAAKAKRNIRPVSVPFKSTFRGSLLLTTKRNERGEQYTNSIVYGITKLHTLLTFGTKMIALPLLPFPSFLVVALLTGCEELGNVSKTGRSPDTQEHPKLCIVEIQERLASVVFHLRQKQSFALLKYPNHQSPRRVA